MRSLCFALGDFVWREQRFACIAGGTLQRDLVLLRPDALQVGVAPRGF